MKLIRKFGFEILLGILGVAFFTGTLYIILVMPEDLMVRGTIMFGLFFDAIAIYYVLRRLWRTKWRYRVMPAVQKVFEKLAKVFKIIGKKLGIKEREPQTVLKGRSIIFFDTKPINEQTKRKKKPSAWKNLQTDKERLGYLYRKMIDTNIHQGLPVFASETPTEIKDKKEYREHENQIFDLYVANRYRDDVDLDADILNDLKQEIKNAK